MLIDAIMSTLESIYDAVRWGVLNPLHKMSVVLLVIEVILPALPVLVPPFHKERQTFCRFDLLVDQCQQLEVLNQLVQHVVIQFSLGFAYVQQQLGC